MLLQHIVKYHETRYWICLQDQTQLTYQFLLTNCDLLEQRCKEFQKAQAKGRAKLTTLSSASYKSSTIH